MCMYVCVCVCVCVCMCVCVCVCVCVRDYNTLLDFLFLLLFCKKIALKIFQFSGDPVASSEVTTMDVFQEFYAKLVEVLPMDGLCFISNLVVCRILSVDVRFQVQLFSLNSQAEKASYFLDHVIWPLVNNGSDGMLYELLEVMKDTRFNQVRELATLIRFGLDNKSRNSNTG